MRTGGLTRGLVAESLGLSLITEEEVFGKRLGCYADGLAARFPDSEIASWKTSRFAARERTT